MKIKRNLYYLTDLFNIGAAASLIGALTKSNEKPFVDSMILCTFSAAAVLAMEYFYGMVVVNNPYEYEFAYKPEDGVTPIYTKEKTTKGVDGIKINGNVYKFRNGTHITIEKDGTITTSSFTGKLINKIKAGKIKTPPDNTWEPLFEA